MCAFDVIIETALGVEVHAQTSGDRHYLTDAFNKGAESVTSRLSCMALAFIIINVIFFQLRSPRTISFTTTFIRVAARL